MASKTDNLFARATIKRWSVNPKVKIIWYDKVFNFSLKCNLGAQAATGDVFLFMNDDIVPVSEHWLEDLIVPFEEVTVAVSGPLLLYPNERVQHGGMYLGFNNVAGHTLRHARLPRQDYMFLASAPREVSAVTGALLAIRREIFQDLHGFDEQLGNFLQDVDLCLRVIGTGYRIVFNPRSILLHMESVTVKDDMEADPQIQAVRGLEYQYFAARWGARLFHDQYHNPGYSLDDESLCSLDANELCRIE